MKESFDSSIAMTEQQKKFSRGAGFSSYRQLVAGEDPFLLFAYNEIVTFFFGNTSGLLGYAARRVLYPRLFASCGRKVAIGKGGVIRRPSNISLDDGVLIDDYVALDVRGASGYLKLGAGVTIGRNSSVVAKNSKISLGNGVNVGTHCRLATESGIEIGDSTLIAAYAYIGPGNHQPGDHNTPLISRPMEIKGGVRIGSNVWIGTKATILDGVTIGDRAIVGAHSLVTTDVPSDTTVVGTPARILERRCE